MLAKPSRAKTVGGRAGQAKMMMMIMTKMIMTAQLLTSASAEVIESALLRLPITIDLNTIFMPLPQPVHSLPLGSDYIIIYERRQASAHACILFSIMRAPHGDFGSRKFSVDGLPFSVLPALMAHTAAFGVCILYLHLLYLVSRVAAVLLLLLLTTWGGCRKFVRLS